MPNIVMFEAVVDLVDGTHLNVLFSDFTQLCYHLDGLDKSHIREIHIKTVRSTRDIRQGRYDN